MPQQAAKSKLEARPAAQSGIPAVSDQKPRIHPWTLGVILAVMMGGTNHGASGRIGADGTGTTGWSEAIRDVWLAGPV
jgi:hypothetical protein